jgi:hypothetical protein
MNVGGRNTSPALRNVPQNAGYALRLPSDGERCRVTERPARSLTQFTTPVFHSINPGANSVHCIDDALMEYYGLMQAHLR